MGLTLGTITSMALRPDETPEGELLASIESQSKDTGITTTPKFGGVERTQAEKNAETVSIEDFGAKAGVDSTLAFQKALDHGGYLFIPPKRYIVNSTLKMKANTTLIGYGAEIEVVGNGENPLIIATGSYSPEIAISQTPQLVGGIDDQKTLITTVSVHGLSVGDRVLIQSQRDALSNDSKEWRLGTATGNADSIHFSEVLTVQKVVSETSFYTTKQLEYPYYFAGKESGVDLSPNARDASTVRKLNLAKNVNILGLNIFGNSGGGQPSANSIVLGFCESPLIRDVKVIKENGHGRGISLVNCWKGVVDNCEVDNSATYYSSVDEAHVPDNHISFINSWFCKAINCGSLHAGQSFDTTYGSPNLIDVLAIRCPSIHITVDNCFVDGSLDNGATNHSGSYKMTINGCTFVGSARFLLIRSPYTTVSNCFIHTNPDNIQSQAGIYFAETTVQGCRVFNNEFVGGDIAIYINIYSDRGDPPYSKDLNISICNNTMRDVGSAMVVENWVYALEDDGTTLTQLAKDSANIVFANNTVYHSETATREAILLGDYINGVLIKDNNINSTRSGFLIRASESSTDIKVIGNKTNLTTQVLLRAPLFITDTPINRQLSSNLNSYVEYYNNSTNGARVSSFPPYLEVKNPARCEVKNLTSASSDCLLVHNRANYKTVNVMTDTMSRSYITYVNSDGDKSVGFTFRASATENSLALNVGSGGITVQESQVDPMVDNVVTLGRVNKRFTTINLSSAPVVTSDERLKTTFNLLKDSEKRAALKIKETIGRYQFTDAIDSKGDKARYHFGVGAQTVAKILHDEGLNPEQYAFYCYDEWESEKEILDDDGSVLQEAQASGSRYGIRYEELIMFILASI